MARHMHKGVWRSKTLNTLSRITEREIVSWQVGVQREYEKQAKLFVLSAPGLQEEAASRNLDAARHDYPTLTASCLHCHAHVRRLKTISYEPGIGSD